jgi:transcriptional regulator with PAS, ATPase and Fis domain
MNSALNMNSFDGIWTKEIHSLFNQPDRNYSIQRISIDRYIPNHSYVPENELKHRIEQFRDIINFCRPLINNYAPNFDHGIHLTLIDGDGCVLFSLNEHHIGAICPGFMLINQNNSLKETLRNGTIIELYSKKANEHLVCMPINTKDSALYLTIANMHGKIPSENINWVFSIYKVLLVQFLMTRQFLYVTTSLLEINPDCALIVNENGCIIDANSNLLSLLSIDSKEVLKGCNITEFISGSNGVFDFDNLLIGNLYKVYSQNRWVTVKLISKKIVNSPSGYSQYLLLLKKQNEPEISRFSKEGDNMDSLIGFQDIIATSPKMKKNIELAEKAAPLSTTVLIEGESGTGKDLIAQSIHNASGRKGPFVAINCGAIPRELLQSELFGYADGTFTGAKKGGKAGKIVEADGGTLFLDEIGEMPKDMQVTLLRFLQNKIVTPLGDIHPRKVNVRIIAATNRNLHKEVEEGVFREDLYYRLNVVNVKLPPLKERKEDIPLLAQHILKEICEIYEIPLKSLSPNSLNELLLHDWPGNVRELQNVLERAIVVSEQKEILPEDLFIEELLPKPRSVEQEKDIIISLLAKHDGNISATAKEMRIARSTLYRKMKNFRIK